MSYEYAAVCFVGWDVRRDRCGGLRRHIQSSQESDLYLGHSGGDSARHPLLSFESLASGYHERYVSGLLSHRDDEYFYCSSGPVSGGDIFLEKKYLYS